MSYGQTHARPCKNVRQYLIIFPLSTSELPACQATITSAVLTCEHRLQIGAYFSLEHSLLSTIDEEYSCFCKQESRLILPHAFYATKAT